MIVLGNSGKGNKYLQAKDLYNKIKNTIEIIMITTPSKPILVPKKYKIINRLN